MNYGQLLTHKGVSILLGSLNNNVNEGKAYYAYPKECVGKQTTNKKKKRKKETIKS